MNARPPKSLPVAADCAGCGVCCMHMGYPSYLHDLDNQPDEEHWTAMPIELKRQLQSYIADYKAPADGELDGPCVWLDMDSRRCMHHQHRPQVCRDFEIGSRGCLDWRQALQEKIVG